MFYVVLGNIEHTNIALEKIKPKETGYNPVSLSPVIYQILIKMKDVC